jgi:hypothetical protein
MIGAQEYSSSHIADTKLNLGVAAAQPVQEVSAKALGMAAC